jgi:hypothetical protein
VPHQPFDERHDLGLGEERSLDVELGEFRLAVRAQVLVAKAAHDLVVAVEARDHQQLLEDLGRLRQCKEFARVGAARHEIVARTLRSRLGEHRRLEVDEAMAIEISAHRAREPMPQPQPLGHDLAAQIEIPIAQAHLLAHLLIELERQGF